MAENQEGYQEALRRIEAVKQSGAKELDLSFLKLKELPPEIQQLSKLTTLDLRSNSLSALPDWFQQLSNLTALHLGRNSLSALPDWFPQLSKLTTLDLGGNSLTALPDWFPQLSKLTTLDLGGNSLTALPDWFPQLSNLTSLYLSSNSLSALPDWFPQLSNLTTLDLGFNSLSALPDGFPQLSNLTALDLRSNSLTALPDGFPQLSNLTALDLGFNSLSALPDGFPQLSNLTTLDLRSNSLSALPDGFPQLSKLTTLDLSFNSLSALPDWFPQLSKLTSLYLSSNSLSALPDGFPQLSKLTSLDLGGNSLSALPDWFPQLSNLTTLDLRGNSLSALPDGFQQLSKLEILDLRGNPGLPFPPEILEDYRNPQRILDYLAELQAAPEEARRLNEARIIIVGQGSVGKTSLVKRLVSGDYDAQEDKTPGVRITDWQVPIDAENIDVHLWDFGGQEIMHATHQFFLTRRSLYLLVLDCRLSEEDNRLDYWLEMIQTFGAGSPLLVVGNKVDQHPLELDEPGLQGKYPMIEAFLPTSAATEEGLDDLREWIFRLVPELPNVRDPLPEGWFAVKERLEGLAEPHIGYTAYREICRAEGVPDTKTQESLVRFLHELGVIFSFHDEESGIPLEQTRVLDPNWVTRGVYKVLNDPGLIRDHGGIFGWPALRQVLTAPDYPDNLSRGFIMDLMGKFERAFSWGEGRYQKFLVPDLFPKSEVDSGDWEDALKFEYHYEVLFPGLIARIMVRHNELIKREWSWRSGAVFEHNGNQALVKADKAKGTITLAVRGPEGTRRELLAVLRMDIDSINRRLEMKVRQYVPVPGHPEVLVDYELVQKMVRMGEGYIIPPDLAERVQLKDLIGAYRSELEKEAEARARTDERWREEDRQKYEALRKEIKGQLDSIDNKVSSKEEEQMEEKKPVNWFWPALVLLVLALGTPILYWVVEVPLNYLLWGGVPLAAFFVIFVLTATRTLESGDATSLLGRFIGLIEKLLGMK